ncbi:MAG: serine hydrolase domain-containing protein [Pirellulales bacterium]
MTNVARKLVWCAVPVVGILAFSAAHAAAEPRAPEPSLPATGKPVAGMEAYDQLADDLLAKWKIPGCAIAVARQGKLVFARGYGYADLAAKRVVEPDSLFRIASISKPVTAVAVLRLVELGKLKLDDRVTELLANLKPQAEPKLDARWTRITVRHLLEHSGGWDRDKSFDPMFRPGEIAKSLGAPAPADTAAVIRYMFSKPLDFDPGQRFAYSNFGYALLGRIIERRTGKSYADAVQELVLLSAGITRMRLGRTLTGFRAASEVAYCHCNAEKAEPVFPYVKGPVEWPDGGFHLEAMDAHGGWIASAIDLVRFASAVDGRCGRPILATPSIRQMLARPELAEPKKQKNAPAGSYYACGWFVHPVGDDANWWHTGSLPGTTTLLVRAHNGLCWAILFNSRPNDQLKFKAEFDAGMWKAAGSVEKWPEHELFQRQPY